MRPDAPDTPRSEPCAEVNPALWSYFCQTIGEIPTPALWSEAEVVQTLDQMDIARHAVETTLQRLALFFAPTYGKTTRPH